MRLFRFPFAILLVSGVASLAGFGCVQSSSPAPGSAYGNASPTTSPTGTTAKRNPLLASDVPVAIALPAAASLRARATDEPGFVFIGSNARGYREFLRKRDGMVCVEVPAGWFVKRSVKSLPASLTITGEPNLPEGRRMFVPRLLVDQHEVTNAQVARFLASRDDLQWADGSVSGPDGHPWASTHEWGLAIAPAGAAVQPGYDHHPAVACSGYLMQAYAEWVGGVLPFGYELEKAAAGASGLLFPWGDDSTTPDCTRCNFLMDGPRCTVPVGSYPRGVSPYGIHDLVGNVYERAFWGGEDVPEDKPVIDGVIDELPPTMIKGGAWLSPHWFNLRCVCRCAQPMHAMEASVGFRTVIRDEAMLATILGTREQLRIVTNPFDGLAEASERNVPIFLFLGYETCGQCDRLRAELFHDPAFVEYCNENLVVMVGHDPRGELFTPLPVQNDRLVPYDYPLDDMVGVFWFFSYENPDVPKSIAEFIISPGLFCVNPHQELYESPDDMVLIPETRFMNHKTGGECEYYLSLFREARQMLGRGLTRAEYLAGVEHPETSWRSPGTSDDPGDPDDNE